MTTNLSFPEGVERLSTALNADADGSPYAVSY